MLPVTVCDLKIGDKFFLHPSFTTEWTLIDLDPPEYSNCVRIKSSNITSPLSCFATVYLQKSV